MAAPPLLASTLLLETEQAEQPHLHLNPVHPQGVLTGFQTIDQNVLSMGFQRGLISAISGGSGTGKSLLALHTVTTYLLTHEQPHPDSHENGSEPEKGKGQVAIIDTTGSFSPLMLRDVIISRLTKKKKPSHDEKDAFENNQEEDELMMRRAMRLLDRVRIMRVFDLEGVVEAVEELRIDLEMGWREDAERREAGMGMGMGMYGVEESLGDENEDDGVRLRDDAMKRDETMREMEMEVADSEDDDEDEMHVDDGGSHLAHDRDSVPHQGEELPHTKLQEGGERKDEEHPKGRDETKKPKRIRVGVRVDEPNMNWEQRTTTDEETQEEEEKEEEKQEPKSSPGSHRRLNLPLERR
ncbi:MAG: hypothetical protein M1823_004558 [Watsoniomyces obsoletus]|nr:MAG: hypothetical protein M1823_004558 [Watsoniomyces obsoletus]